MGINLGPLTIRFYGLIIMAGVLAGAFLADRRARKRGENPDIVWDALIWVIIGGIAGARIWHILTPPPSMVARGITMAYYLSNPLEALAIWRGGLGIPGAVIGGVLALYFFTKRRGISFLTWVDLAAPSLALGQAIGRWGNFVNQELYGAPTDLPWAIYINPMHRLPGYLDQATYHPLFLYESLWNLGSMLMLLWLGWKFAHRLKAGDLFLAYLIIYPAGRFLLDFLRLDASLVAGLNVNQLLMAMVALSSFVLLRVRRSRWNFRSIRSDARAAE